MKTQNLAALAACMGFALIACSSTSNGAGSSSSTSSSSTSSSTSSGSGGSDPACAPAPGDSTVAIELTLPDGTKAPCEGADKLYDLTGVVQASPSADTLVLDTCAPNAKCAPALAKLTVQATDLAFGAPKGSFARIRLGNKPGGAGGCVRGAVVNEVDSFGGMKAPMASHRVWLVASSGDLYLGSDPMAVLADLPFTMTTTKLAQCAPLPQNCDPIGPQGPFGLSFTDKMDPMKTGVAKMNGPLKGFASGGQSFDVHDAKSVSFGGCDETNVFAWWLAPSANGSP